MAAPARSVSLPLPASWRRARPGVRPGVGVAVPAWLPGLLVAVLLTLPAWAPFLRPDLNLWQLFDGSSHLRKAWLLAQLIKDGNWYPRWIPDLYGGYGYPTFTFYAPATYYLTLALALLPRIGLYEAFQVLGAGGAAAIVGGVYALAWRLWRHAPAAVWSVAAVAYAPYLFPNNLFMSGWVPQILGNALTVWLLVALLGLWQTVAAPRASGTPAGAPAGAPHPEGSRVERAAGPPPKSSERSERLRAGCSQRVTGEGVQNSDRLRAG
jgi:hypothetical protein